MESKRHTLKLLIGGGAALTALPKNWHSPLVKSVVLPAHAQTSMNQAPIGESFTINVSNDSNTATDLSSRISDPEGDPITITLLDQGVLNTIAGPFTFEVELDGTVLRVRALTGVGDAFVDYNLTDGMATSPTYRITFTNLADAAVT